VTMRRHCHSISTGKTKSALMALMFYSVEMGGIEPPSENGHKYESSMRSSS